MAYAYVAYYFSFWQYLVNGHPLECVKCIFCRPDNVCPNFWAEHVWYSTDSTITPEWNINKPRVLQCVHWLHTHIAYIYALHYNETPMRDKKACMYVGIHIHYIHMYSHDERAMCMYSIFCCTHQQHKNIYGRSSQIYSISRECINIPYDIMLARTHIEHITHRKRENMLVCTVYVSIFLGPYI